jgi:hypothetical protein
MINKRILLIILILSVCGSFLFAQNQTDESKRQAEHEAVKNHLDERLSNQKPPAVVNNNAKIDKYSVSNGLQKTTGFEDRKTAIMNGNRITVQVSNYGGISPGFGLIRHVNGFVWNDLGYVFTFGPVVGAEVVDEKGDTVHIISDALNDYVSFGLQEISPSGDTLWQWQPLPGYADPDQPTMAINPSPDSDGDGKPDSWPRSWYNESLGRYIWPGYLSQDVTNSDVEVFWAMDDRDNKEFDYYPFNNDRVRQGLGVQVDGRAFQWSNALAENTIFFVYSITNVSDKPLDKVFFGLYGDPDLGGGGAENSDDRGLFVPPYSLDSVDVTNIPVYARSMVYLFDNNGIGDFGLPLGYLGCKFLESPGNPENGIDDDGDGMTDERQNDGIDNDGDWDPLFHDVGIDGVPNTNDPGEGDGIPTAGRPLADLSPDPLAPGEPNFEYTDLDESDQIGLTSFNSWTWSSGGGVNDDELMWARNVPGNFSDVASFTDLVFIFGSGYISLEPGETKRISMALLVGEDRDDLLTTAEIVQTIYNENYQFFKPPNKPTVRAVPGDKKVTLYWDDLAESSTDPLTGEDFEGYVIYRSTDPSFEDIQVITDGKGSGFLSEPLKGVDGTEAKFDVGLRDEPYVDLNANGLYDVGEPYTDWNTDQQWTQNVEDPWKGYHPIPYQKRGLQYYLGDNTGLVHSYVDSNDVINGQTYYYAVVAYDHGDSVRVPVSETTKKITIDPITNEFTFDKNTVMVVPGPRPSGYVEPQFESNDLQHISGIATGYFTAEIVDDLKAKADGEYEIFFEDSLELKGNKIARKNYSILDLKPITESIKLFEEKYANFQNSGVWKDDQFSVKKADGTLLTENIDYIVDYNRGAIKRIAAGAIVDQETVEVTYRYRPIIESTNLDGEEANSIFDGLHIKVFDEAALEWDKEESGWIVGESNYTQVVQGASVGQIKALYPGDFEIEIADSGVILDSAITFTNTVETIGVNYTVREVARGVSRRVVTFLSENPATRDQQWDPRDAIIFFTPGSEGTIADTLTWEWTVIPPDTSVDSTIVPQPPKGGDIYYLKTKRPFTEEDRFLIKTKAGELDDNLAKSGLDNIYVVPNPYVGFNELEPTNPLPGQSRGERRIYFENLPSKCTIRIFTLSGDPVKKIEHDSGLEHGREYWNLLNEDGFGVAYGVYIAHIDAPGIGEKIVKFALIK